MCGNFICGNYDNLAFLKKVAGSLKITGLPLMKYLLITRIARLKEEIKSKGVEVFKILREKVLEEGSNPSLPSCLIYLVE